MEPTHHLTTLARADAGAVKLFAEALIPSLEPIRVVRNRTGLVMLPMEETVRGEVFYLGEVLVAEAMVEACGATGYGACLGRDLEQSLALALIDAAYSADIERQQIAAFVAAQAALLADADAELLRQVAQTKVDLETF